MLKPVAGACLVALILAQSSMDALLEIPKLDPSARVASLTQDDAPVRVVMSAIVAMSNLTVHYDQSVPALEKKCSVSLTNVPLERALDTVLRKNGMDFIVLQPKELFIYSATPENREKFGWKVRTFQLAHADAAVLTQALNKQFTATKGPGFRPIILADRTPPTIRVRAVGEQMTAIAQFIADNDK